MVAKGSLDLTLQRSILVVMKNERTLANDTLPGVDMMKKTSSAGGFVFGNSSQSNKTFGVDQIASSVCCVASLGLITISDDANSSE